MTFKVGRKHYRATEKTLRVLLTIAIIAMFFIFSDGLAIGA